MPIRQQIRTFAAVAASPACPAMCRGSHSVSGFTQFLTWIRYRKDGKKARNRSNAPKLARKLPPPANFGGRVTQWPQPHPPVMIAMQGGAFWTPTVARRQPHAPILLWKSPV
jgi:hypothetical protein